MTVRIGANPIGWSNDDMLEIGGDISLQQCLTEAREAGFVGMELGNKFPRQPEALKQALAPFGMACVSGWYSAELLTRSAEDEIRALPHETLVVHGREDQVIPVETSLKLSTLIENADLHVFSHCGHWSQIERSAEFNRIVGDFLSR